MYHIEVPVEVLEIKPNEGILIQWGSGDQLSKVHFAFKSINESTTYLTITNSELQGEGSTLVNNAIDSMGGFTMAIVLVVLAGLKAYLEFDIELNLIGDKFPKELRTPDA